MKGQHILIILLLATPNATSQSSSSSPSVYEKALSFVPAGLKKSFEAFYPQLAKSIRSGVTTTTAGAGKEMPVADIDKPMQKYDYVVR